jgi:hypothetical protein
LIESFWPTPTVDGVAVIAGPAAAEAGNQATMSAGSRKTIGTVARMLTSRLVGFRGAGSGR